MAWNNSSDTLIAGSGQVYVAATGSTLPTTPTGTVDTAFVGLGYHTEDGVSLSAPVNIIDYPAWQSKHPIRREVDTRDFTLSFSLLQWDEDTVPLAFGGGSISSVSGGYKFTPPQSTDAITEKALICDIDDGSERTRIIIPRGSVTEGVDTSLTRTSMSALSVTFKALQPTDGSAAWYFLTSDSTAYASGS